MLRQGNSQKTFGYHAPASCGERLGVLHLDLSKEHPNRLGGRNAQALKYTLRLVLEARFHVSSDSCFFRRPNVARAGYSAVMIFSATCKMIQSGGWRRVCASMICDRCPSGSIALLGSAFTFWESYNQESGDQGHHRETLKLAPRRPLRLESLSPGSFRPVSVLSLNGLQICLHVL